jgi:hypothetical protein
VRERLGEGTRLPETDEAHYFSVSHRLSYRVGIVSSRGPQQETIGLEHRAEVSQALVRKKPRLPECSPMTPDRAVPLSGWLTLGLDGQVTAAGWWIGGLAMGGCVPVVIAVPLYETRRPQAARALSSRMASDRVPLLVVR